MSFFGFLSVNIFVITLLVLAVHKKRQEQGEIDKVKGNLKFGSQRIGVTVVGNQRCACHGINNISPLLKWVALKIAEVVD